LGHVQIEQIGEGRQGRDGEGQDHQSVGEHVLDAEACPGDRAPGKALDDQNDRRCGQQQDGRTPQGPPGEGQSPPGHEYGHRCDQAESTFEEQRQGEEAGGQESLASHGNSE
jgi:hypothetical protein